VTERPILFSAPMVRAILAGQKTQTRRVVKPQPELAQLLTHSGWSAWFDGHGRPLRNPYGQPGDRLWVREAWAQNWNQLSDTRMDRSYVYRADGEGRAQDNGTDLPWRPSIHMPRAASRLSLEITGVRVERLQAISEVDARAEGVERIDIEFGMRLRTPHWRAYGNEDTQYCISPEASFQALWRSINGTESWDANPFVWAVEFKRLEAGHA